MSLEGVVKSHEDMTQVSNKEYTLFEGSRGRNQASIKGRLFEGSLGLMEGSMVYFVSTLVCMSLFWEAQSKGTRAYAQSAQYYTIVEICNS